MKRPREAGEVCSYDFEMPDAFEKEMLERFVSGRDVPCPGCGYSLRDLRTDRCPECGDGLELRVNLAEQKLGVFIACVVGLSVGLGFNSTVLIWTGVVRIFGGYHLGLKEVSPPLISTVVLGGCLWVLLLRRRWFRQRRVLFKVGLVASAWAASALSAVMFFLVV